MDIVVNANKLQQDEQAENGGHIKGLASINFGDLIKVRSVAIMEGKNQELFVSMPSYMTKEVDESGKNVFRSYCNPITKEMHELLSKAVLESYESGQTVKVSDGADRKMSIVANALEEPRNGLVGNAKLYINNSFVVSGIGVRQGSNDRPYITMPSYKTNKVNEQGKPVYQEVAYATTDIAKRQLQMAVIAKYKESQAEVMEKLMGVEDMVNPFLDSDVVESPEPELAEPVMDEKPLDDKAKDKKTEKKEEKSIAESLKRGKEKVAETDAQKPPALAADKDKNKGQAK